MSNPPHAGLTFTQQAVDQARKHGQHAPFKAAWDYLRADAPPDPLACLLWNAQRWRLDGDQTAGARAAADLESHLSAADTESLWGTLARSIALAQCVELLRDHPASQLDSWRASFDERVSRLTDAPDPSFVDVLWLMALNATAGVVLEDATRFEGALSDFRRIVGQEIHPEGYLPQAVERYPEVESLTNQLRAVQALVLCAEVARHAGADLWGYSVRGVSVLTATTYPLYYYFYPEKWPWNGEQWKPSDGVAQETAARLFRENSGFLEIVNHHYGARPLKAIRMILDELRPVFDVHAGGLTTLTHGIPERRGLFG